jgi:hypothetical protein
MLRSSSPFEVALAELGAAEDAYKHKLAIISAMAREILAATIQDADAAIASIPGETRDAPMATPP